MRLRRATATDRPFLEEMIVQAAFPPGRIPSLPEALRLPHVAPWIDGWMRDGDLGIIADDKAPLGAAWCRRFGGHEPGLSGFVDSSTPVLAIAVVAGHRGHGIGTALLEELATAARAERINALSLSVGRTNPALRLYERLGWRRIADGPDRPVRLLRHLSDVPPCGS